MGSKKSLLDHNKKQQEQQVLFGKYELGHLLGRGTFAKVYFARALADGSPVAVKVLDKRAMAGTGVAPTVLREVSAMRRLSPHPNILKLHEVMATRSRIYLVMEHARGGELFARLARRGRLPEPAARRYFQQLLSALRFSHAHGIAHRDVKPENLRLDRDGGELKLSDFGLSALPDQLRADGLLYTACGTPAYTAPEVMRRAGGYDGAKADAWSCGVFLYVLLAGSLPFDDSNLALMCRRMQRREYRLPQWLSSSAKRVISRLLDPNPETRTSLDGVMELPWIRRCYSLDSQLSLQLPGGDEGREFAMPTSASAPSFPPLSMNAFDIISLSSGLDLSGLFDDDGDNGQGRRRKEERRFTSTASVDRILERVEEVVGGKLGYAIERRKGEGGVVWMGRWGSVLSVEVLEVAPPILLVELRLSGGSRKDDDSLHWGDLRAELGDVVFDWHKNTGGGGE
ncbi:CBL-interacting serine/threonine-protein kinase 12-like [Iris pallida]|uniref:non-specific serine/threonine protein kinase n=1 Tax=Iris pallida TaxID=29817 RepID=A0AAX6GMY9_IRIPA|nr:CBL-interacting serine/threonine-protein kinase 12-like [Iris pallida]